MENFKQFKNTKYSIGDHGNIISEQSWRGSSSRVLTPHLVKGYEAIELVYDGDKHFHKVHRLVAEVFVPNPLKLNTVNHKDFNKLNNAYTNLEWLSLSENVKNAWENDRMPIGSSRVNSILSDNDVENIKLLFVEDKLNNQQIGDIFGVARSTISQIRKLRAWGHIRPDLIFLNESQASRGSPKKLCGEDIPIIRRSYANGQSLREIGKAFGVNYGTINRIISGKNWKNY